MFVRICTANAFPFGSVSAVFSYVMERPCRAEARKVLHDKKDAHRCKKYVIALRYTFGAAKMCGTHSCYHVEEGRRKDDVPYEKK